MRRFLAISLCKMLYFAGSRMGRGSSLPGRIALILYPDVLKSIKLPETIIAITGSNGKTSTTEMLVRALESCGKSVSWNHEGANQIEGVTTLVLRTATLGGVVKRDALVFECDERYTHSIFRFIRPTELVVTNLCRDQLTRNGHHEFVQGCIQAAIEVAGDDMKLILNADDPYVAMLAGIANSRENDLSGETDRSLQYGDNENDEIGSSDHNSGSDDGIAGSKAEDFSQNRETGKRRQSEIRSLELSGVCLRDEPEMAKWSDEPALKDSASLHVDSARVIWFGISRDVMLAGSVNSESEKDMTRSVKTGFTKQARGDDGQFCPECKERLTYDSRVAAHMGAFRCKVCSYCRPDPDFEATGLDRNTGEVTIAIKPKSPASSSQRESITARLEFPSLTGAYNLTAAITAASAAGVPAGKAASALDGYGLKGGRTVRFSVGGHEGILLVSKHENSLSYNQSLLWAVSAQKPCTVVILVDSISRKYYTSETSWLWDIDFDILANECVKSIVLAGRYVNELMSRFAMSETGLDKVCCVASLDDLHDVVAGCAVGDIYSITCFSDKAKLLKAFS